MDYAYGAAGLVLILIGWIYETAKTIKRGKSTVPLEFAVLYATGSFLLLVYSWLLNDFVFIALNFFATLVPLINIYFIFKKKRAQMDLDMFMVIIGTLLILSFILAVWLYAINKL